MAGDPEHPYVSRGGLKLEAALDGFGIDVRGLVCVDLGASVGGFSDCLLQRDAAHVICVDTAYGQLAWRVRSDERVTVIERTNALHVDPVPPAPVDLAVIDLGWTPQRLAIPAALRWLKPGGQIITLIKPHYEAKEVGRESEIVNGTLREWVADEITEHTLESMPTLGVRTVASIRSPIHGGGKRGKKQGNIEHLALLTPIGHNDSSVKTP